MKSKLIYFNNLTKAETIKKLKSYGVKAAEAREAVAALAKNKWANNDVNTDTTTYIILFEPEKRRKYTIMFKSGIIYNLA